MYSSGVGTQVDDDDGGPSLESGRPGVVAPRRLLLDALGERLQSVHDGLPTEEAHVHWVRGFIQWAGRRRPREMGAAEVRDFLTMLASEHRVLLAGTDTRAVQSLLGHGDVGTTRIYTQVLKSSPAGTASPLDGLMAVPMPTMKAGEDDDDRSRRNALRRPPLRAHEPRFPCSRATPSFTAAATSAS
jgi:hypothetical protein